jgi:hypothetical protein
MGLNDAHELVSARGVRASVDLQMNDVRDVQVIPQGLVIEELLRYALEIRRVLGVIKINHRGIEVEF